MKYIIFLFISIVTVLNFVICQETTMETFEDYIVAVNQMENSNNFEVAIELTKAIWNKYPDKRFELIKEMEYLNKKTNRYQDNLNLWHEGHKDGYFFLLNKQMKQYEPYQKYSMFDTLVDYDRFLRNEALKNSESTYEVSLPLDYSNDKNYPLLIILHGGGSNIEKAKARWLLTDHLKINFIVVFIQSYRHYDSKTFGWTSSDIRTHSDIKEIFSELKNQYSIDNSKIIIGGTSAGGTMAFDIAFNQVISANRIIVFCPGIPKEFKIHDESKNIKVYMLAGKSDYNRPKQEEMIKIFSKENIRYKYKIINGMGHEFPRDYEVVINDALKFLKM